MKIKVLKKGRKWKYTAYNIVWMEVVPRATSLPGTYPKSAWLIEEYYIEYHTEVPPNIGCTNKIYKIKL